MNLRSFLDLRFLVAARMELGLIIRSIGAGTEGGKCRLDQTSPELCFINKLIFDSGIFLH